MPVDWSEYEADTAPAAASPTNWAELEPDTPDDSYRPGSANPAPVDPLAGVKLSPYEQADYDSEKAGLGKPNTGMEAGTELISALAGSAMRGAGNLLSLPGKAMDVLDKGLTPKRLTPKVPLSDEEQQIADQFEQVRRQNVAAHTSPPRTFREWATTPAVPFKKNEIHPDDSVVQSAGREIYNQLVSLPELASTPLGLGAAATGGLGGGAAVRVGFLADMAKSLFEQAPALYQNWDKMTPAERAKSTVDFLSTAGMVKMLAKGHGPAPDVGFMEERPGAGGNPLAVPDPGEIVSKYALGDWAGARPTDPLAPLAGAVVPPQAGNDLKEPQVADVPGTVLRRPTGAVPPRGEPAPGIETVSPGESLARAQQMTDEATASGVDDPAAAKPAAAPPVEAVPPAAPVAPSTKPPELASERSPEQPPTNPAKLLRPGENMNQFLDRATDDELRQMQEGGTDYENWLREERTYRQKAKDATWSDLNPLIAHANHLATAANWELTRRASEKGADAAAAPVAKEPVTAQSLVGMTPEAIADWKQTAGYGPEMMKAMAAQVKPDDLPAMIAERDRMRSQYSAQLKSLEKMDLASPEAQAIWADSQNNQLKAQTLNEMVENAPKPAPEVATEEPSPVAPVAPAVSRVAAGKALRKLVETDRDLAEQLAANHPMDLRLNEDGSRVLMDADSRSRGPKTGGSSGATTEFINWLMTTKGEGIAPDSLASHMADVNRAREIITGKKSAVEPPAANVGSEGANGGSPSAKVDLPDAKVESAKEPAAVDFEHPRAGTAEAQSLLDKSSQGSKTEDDLHEKLRQAEEVEKKAGYGTKRQEQASAKAQKIRNALWDLQKENADTHRQSREMYLEHLIQTGHWSQKWGATVELLKARAERMQKQSEALREQGKRHEADDAYYKAKQLGEQARKVSNDGYKALTEEATKQLQEAGATKAEADSEAMQSANMQMSYPGMKTMQELHHRMRAIEGERAKARIDTEAKAMMDEFGVQRDDTFQNRLRSALPNEDRSREIIKEQRAKYEADRAEQNKKELKAKEAAKQEQERQLSTARELQAKGKLQWVRKGKEGEPGIWYPVEGKPVKVKAAPNHEFFVYKSGVGQWSVSESKTGLMVGMGKTQGEALQMAEEKIGKLGVDRMNEVIAKSLSDAPAKPSLEAQPPAEPPKPAEAAKPTLEQQRQAVAAKVDANQKLTPAEKKIWDAMQTGPKADEAPQVEAGPSPSPDKGIGASVRRKWASATDDKPLGSEAGFFTLAPIKDLLDRVGPAVRASIEAVRNAARENFDVRKSNDYRRSVLNWSAKLQRSFGEAAEAQKEIRDKVRDPVRRAAITNWIQAGGDPAVLRQRAIDTDAWRDPATGKPHPQQKQLVAGYEAALHLTPEELSVANDAKAAYDALLNRGMHYGVIQNFKDNYVTQIWDLGKSPRPKPTGSGGGSRMLKDRFKFSKASTFDTFFDGEQAGYVPKTKDISALLPVYLHEMNSVIAARQLVEQMSKGTASDGKPLLAPRGVGVTVGGPSNQATLVLPDVPQNAAKGYVIIENQPALHEWRWVTKDSAGNPVFNKSDLMVHPEVAAHLKNVLGKSAISEWYNSKTSAAAAIPKALVKGLDMAQSETKRTMLGLLTPFHQVQEGTHAIGHKVNPFFNNPKIDLVNDPAQMDAARHGLMLLPDRASENMFMEGFRQSGVISHVPGLGPLADHYSNYLFHEYIPGIKYKTYQAILERNSKRYAADIAAGRATASDVKILSAEQANAAYGHLNYADLGRNPTIGHLARLALLAPDFLEARARFAGQAIKGATGSKIGREQLIALGTLAVAQATLSWTSAKLTGGQWDEKDPFSFHVGNQKFTMRSVPEDLYRGVKDHRAFWYARLNPLVGRGALQYLSGTDWRGQKVGAAQTTKELLQQPIPLALRPLFGIGNTSLSGWEELAGAAGLKISRYSPVAEIQKSAHQWMAASSDPKIKAEADRMAKTTMPQSDYAPLREALEREDYSGAQRAYRALRETHSSPQISDAMNQHRPFSGAAATERKFKASLDEDGKRLYEEAVKSRHALYQRYLQVPK